MCRSGNRGSGSCIPKKKPAAGDFTLYQSGSRDREIIVLDMDEWYLLFQPLFENYFKQIKSDPRNDSIVSCASKVRSFFRLRNIVSSQSVDMPLSQGATGG